MNNIKYFIVESNLSSNEIPLITYGIAAYDPVSPLTVVARISDITSDKKRLEILVDLCNREKLSLVHLNDVVEDFLCC